VHIRCRHRRLPGADGDLGEVEGHVAMSCRISHPRPFDSADNPFGTRTFNCVRTYELGSGESLLCPATDAVLSPLAPGQPEGPRFRGFEAAAKVD